MKNFWLFLMVSLSFICCKTPTYAPDTYEGKMITFGSGGGVTGHISCTAIMENGYIYRGTGLTNIDFEMNGRLKTGEVDQLFKNYEVLGLAEVNYDSPGNTYRFIEFKQDSSIQRIVWGAKDELPDKKVDTYYNILKAKTQQK